jgi:hypothetical protein
MFSKLFLSRHKLAIALTLILVAWGSRELLWSAEESVVCAAAIQSYFSLEHPKPLDHEPKYVLLDSTYPLGCLGMRRFHAKKLGIGWDAYLNYNLKNIFLFSVPSTMKLSHPYVLVSRAELRRLDDPRFLQSPEGERMKRLLFEGWGVVTVSRVGFDLFHRHAVVYIQLTYCGLCGEGLYVYLRKVNGDWNVDSAALTWIS